MWLKHRQHGVAVLLGQATQASEIGDLSHVVCQDCRGHTLSHHPFSANFLDKSEQTVLTSRYDGYNMQFFVIVQYNWVSSLKAWTLDCPPEHTTSHSHESYILILVASNKLKEITKQGITRTHGNSYQKDNECFCRYYLTKRGKFIHRSVFLFSRVLV